MQEIIDTKGSAALMNRIVHAKTSPPPCIIDRIWEEETATDTSMCFVEGILMPPSMRVAHHELCDLRVQQALYTKEKSLVREYQIVLIKGTMDAWFAKELDQRAKLKAYLSTIEYLRDVGAKWHMVIFQILKSTEPSEGGEETN